jgi:capsular exopolysaccharide synthesis family protein
MRFNRGAPVPMSQSFELGEQCGVRIVGDAGQSGPPDRPRPSVAAEVAPGAELDDHLASLLSPNSFEADQYRVLRQFVEQARAGKEVKVLGVTSPAAGDGKTTTAINLAATLAQSQGARVLLVDADLRRPFVTASLGLGADTNGPGLAGAVAEEGVELERVIRKTPYNVDVVPAGAPPENAYEALDSDRVGLLLAEARRSFDWVVLDMPPVLLVPDCRLLSQWVDGYLVVVAAHRTPRRLLAETLNAIDQAKALGIVFNGDNRPLSGYYKSYYGSYHHGRERAGWWPWKWRRRGPGRPEPWR